MATATKVKHSKLDHVVINQGLTIVYPEAENARKSSTEDFSVDIVAVPGLGADPTWTWKSKNKVNWLSDSNMLPRTIPKARIMVFEYESQWFGKTPINQRLSTVADQLLRALFHQRSKGSKRPIVFVCHCLGGIIVEKALISAQLRQLDYPNLITSVIGCVFLGTPFRGTKTERKATRLASMAESIGFGVKSGLLTLLEYGSEMLRDLLSDFSSLARESNMHLFCFFEQHASDMINTVFKGPHPSYNELVVEEDSAHIDGYRTGALAADHFQLNKYEGPKDGRYKAVSNEIKATVQKAGQILKTRQNAIRQNVVDDATYQAIVEDLKVTDPIKDLQHSVKGRPLNQASWALNDDNYCKWFDALESQVLWLHGNAGQGQPVIASLIVHTLEERFKDAEGTFLAYFFCDEKDAHRRTLQDVLKLLIRQMILKNRDLVEHLLVGTAQGKKSNHKTQDFNMATVSDLWKSLLSMLNDTRVDSAYFVINALDEADRESRKDFLSLMEMYLQPSAAAFADEQVTPIKWVFLSRSGRPDIEKVLSHGLVISMEDEKNAALVNDGVKLEISRQVDDFAQEKGLRDGLAYLIKRYVYSKADGNYIYAHLVVQQLRNLELSQLTSSTVRQILEDLPYGLTDMLEFVRRRVLNAQSEDIEYTKDMLRCMLLAVESPSIFELAMMADLPSDVRFDTEAVKKYIRRCGAFLTTSIDSEGFEIVEWVDVVAKEHLTTYAKEQLSLELNDVQHGLIALRCLETVRDLLEDESDDQSDDDDKCMVGDDANTVSDAMESEPASKEDKAQGEDSDDEDTVPGPPVAGTNVANVDSIPVEPQEAKTGLKNENAISSQPASAGIEPHEQLEVLEKVLTSDYEAQFDYYPVKHWLQHAIQAPVDVIDEFDLNDKFWTEKSQTRAEWWHQYSKSTRYAGIKGITPLHIAALSGYSALLDHLLKHGRAEDLHAEDTSGSTPLQWTCDHGDVRAVDRLVKAGANVNKTSESGGSSPLSTAARMGHTEVVQYLLDHGADKDWRGKDDEGTALYLAASNGNTDIVHELLERGADPDLKAGLHLRAINVAALFGHMEVVEILLRHGVDTDLDEDYRYGNALGAAARRGHPEIVRLLLEKGGDVNLKMRTYNAPIVAAAAYGHMEVLEILLQRAAEGQSLVQALEIASRNGRLEIVRALLASKPSLPHQKAFHNAAFYDRDEILVELEKYGTNITMLNTALYHASDQEREIIVKLLLGFGADPNSEGQEYGNALGAAAYDGSMGIVNLLLEYGADVNKQGGEYGTALQAAAFKGHREIVEVLLHHGAQLNVGNIGHSGSALQAACGSSSAETVKLLVEQGADVNSYGGVCGSPIMAAVKEGDSESTRILLENGADVNVRDTGDDYAPLIVEAGYWFGHQDLERLLDRGAYLEDSDRHGTTVLIAVADSADKEGLEMLLRRGANKHALSSDKGTALASAASCGDEECVQILLDHGAAVNQDAGTWGSALQAAAWIADLNCINKLLAAGAKVNQYGGEHGSPLQASATNADTECMQRLLDAGANVHFVGGDMGSALGTAAGHGHLECLELLIEHDADPNLRGGTYECALQAACYRKDNKACVQALLAHGADTRLNGGLCGSVLVAAALSRSLDLFDLLVEHGADVAFEGGRYGNALQAAAMRAAYDFVLRLLQHKVDVNTISGKYNTALQAAAFSGEVRVVNLLLEHNANPQIEGGHYGNALNAPAQRGNLDVLKVLLGQALPYSMLDGALVRAVHFRQEAAVNFLLKKGASADAVDQEFGSPYEVLQKSSGNDVNSDIEDGSEDDDDDDDDEEVEEDDDEEEDTDDETEEGSEDDGDNASTAAGADDGASIDLEIETQVAAEDKIRKYLEDAMSKIKRKPTLRGPAGAMDRKLTLRRPMQRKSTLRHAMQREPALHYPAERESNLHHTVVQRKPVSSSQQLPGTISQYDALSTSGHRQPSSAESRWHPLGQQRHSNAQLPSSDRTAAYVQTVPPPLAAVDSEYAGRGNQLPAMTLPYNPHEYQTSLGSTSGSNSQLYPTSRPQPYPYTGHNQYDSPLQSRPPVPPKASSYGGNTQTSGILRPSNSTQMPDISTGEPPRLPPRSQHNYNNNNIADDEYRRKSSYPSSSSGHQVLNEYPRRSSHLSSSNHPANTDYPCKSSYPGSDNHPVAVDYGHESSHPGSNTYPAVTDYTRKSSYPGSNSYPLDTHEGGQPGSSKYPAGTDYPRNSNHPANTNYERKDSYPSSSNYQAYRQNSQPSLSQQAVPPQQSQRPSPYPLPYANQTSSFPESDSATRLQQAPRQYDSYARPSPPAPQGQYGQQPPQPPRRPSAQSTQNSGSESLNAERLSQQAQKSGQNTRLTPTPVPETPRINLIVQQMSLNDHSSKRVSGKQTAALEPSPYCHLLPASYRTRHDDVAIPTLTPSYLYEQLDVRRLNAIHKWLWLTGRPTPPRPLHYQNAVGRAIVVHEQTDLHLVWDEHRIFLKPIPAYLLEKGVWQDVLTCTSSCDDTSRMKSCAQATRRLPDGESEEKGLYGEDISEGASCDVCQVAALARGFLLSYASLISHESDLHIARSSHLIPETITWQQWRDTVKALLSSTPSSPFAPATFPSSSSSVDTGSSLQTMVNRRYHYGELRLDRLNKIYVLTLRAPLRGYLYGYNTYNQFWSANTARVAALLAYILVVLTAMQVGLATQKLQGNASFQAASWGFTVFSMVAPLAGLGLVGGVLAGMFVGNWVAARRYWKRRMRWIEGRQEWTKTEHENGR